MTSTDTAPAATLRRWQHRAQEQLAAFLARGTRANLPPLTWTLATTGALTGEADSLTYTPDQQRDAIQQWAHHLGIPVEARTTADGREELYAAWSKPVKGEAELRGCFRATIFTDIEGA